MYRVGGGMVVVSSPRGLSTVQGSSASNLTLLTALHQTPTGGDPPGSSPQFTRGYVADGAEGLTRFSADNL